MLILAVDREIPITRHCVPPARADAIRLAVQRATSIDTETNRSRLARLDDTEAFMVFLSDPAVYAPIYTLPDPLTLASVHAFIARHIQEREAGQGLLFLTFDGADRLSGYSDVCLWPHWGAGELGGAIHPDRQSRGHGAKEAKRVINWMFETLGLDLVCETASLANFRTARLLDGLGFTREGEVISRSQSGQTRPSLVWEMTKENWVLNR
ncbi:MAG: hypothetical protein COA69_05990 [Robiginitomaculum sp.]|nr:MAG: hypothetical protein COA69_05990 [Robiginitomaculum sp.]